MNPEDNITHACRALYANEGRYLLTASDIRRIVYGATGRKEPGAGWTVGFGRQVGHFWEVIPWPEGTEGQKKGMIETRGLFVYRLLPRGYKRVHESEGVFNKATYDAENFNKKLTVFPGSSNEVMYRSPYEPVFVNDPEAAGRWFARGIVQDAIRTHEDLDAYLVNEPSDWSEMYEQMHATEPFARIDETNEEWFQHHPDQEPSDVWLDVFGDAAHQQASMEVNAYRNARKWVEIRRSWFRPTVEVEVANGLDNGSIPYNEAIRLSDFSDDVANQLAVIIDDKTEVHSNNAEIEVKFLKMSDEGEYISFDFDALDAVKGRTT